MSLGAGGADAGRNLLLPDEPDPVGVVNPGGKAPVLLLCEHAGRRMPSALNRLGLPRQEIDRHIGWDIGALAVSEAVAERLDTVLFFQRYSRLVIDCNRPPDSPDLIPEISETTVIPGNRQLPDAQRRLRIREIWAPYQQAIQGYLDKKTPPDPLIISMHSFTPVYKNEARPWDIGLLYNRRPETAERLKRHLLEIDSGLVIGMNQPYEVCDAEDYTIPVFGEAMGFPHVLVEIRQDLIQEAQGRKRWIDLFEAAFKALGNI